MISLDAVWSSDSDCCEEVWGRWSEGLQGGYIYDRDFHLNPQIDISVPEGGGTVLFNMPCLCLFYQHSVSKEYMFYTSGDLLWMLSIQTIR